MVNCIVVVFDYMKKHGLSHFMDLKANVLPFRRKALIKACMQGQLDFFEKEWSSGVLTYQAKFTSVWFGSTELTAFAFPSQQWDMFASAADDGLVFSCVIFSKKNGQRLVSTNMEKLDKYWISKVRELKLLFFFLSLFVILHRGEKIFTKQALGGVVTTWTLVNWRSRQPGSCFRGTPPPLESALAAPPPPV